VPSEITVSVGKGNTVTLKGPKGTLEKSFKNYRLNVTASGNNLTVEGSPNNRKSMVLVKSTVAHIRNMIEGLIYGYRIELKVVYSHFPMSVTVEKGKFTIKNFLGEKFPRHAKIIGAATKVEAKGQEVTVTGTNKEDVGQTATNIEQATKVRKKDIRRFQDGIYIVARNNMQERKGPVVEIIRGKDVQ